jgi:hypothetical protein
MARNFIGGKAIVNIDKDTNIILLVSTRKLDLAWQFWNQKF